MAVFNCIEQLEENVLDEGIVPKIATTMQDLGEEIVVRCIVHDNVGVVALVNDVMESDHARVGRGKPVKHYFTDVDLSLTWRLICQCHHYALHTYEMARRVCFWNGQCKRTLPEWCL